MGQRPDCLLRQRTACDDRATSTTELNLYTEYTSLYGTPTTAVNVQVTVNPKGVLAGRRYRQQ